MRLILTDMRTITDDQPRRVQFEYRNQPVTLGSHSQSGIPLPDTRIPEHHATLEPVGNDWFLQPTTRDDELTKINNELVTDRTQINDGDVIAITYFELKIEIEPEAVVDLPTPGKVGELALIKKYPIPPRSLVRKPNEDVSIPPERQKLLGELVVSLRDSGDLAGLLEGLADFLGPHFEARMVWIGVRRKRNDTLDFVESRIEGEHSVASPPKFETYEYRCLSRDQFISIKGTGDGVTQSVLAIPLHGPRFPIGMIYIDTKRRHRVLDGADLDFLTVVASVVTPLFVSALEGPVGLAAAAASGGNGNTIEQIRTAIDPIDLPDSDDFEVAAHAHLGMTNHGDVFDATRMPNGLFVMFAGHVETDAAHLAAALPEIKGAFRIGVLHQHAPATMLKSLNWLLSSGETECLLHAAIALINPKNGVVEIATAGEIGTVAFTSKGVGSKLNSKNAPPAGNGEAIEYSSKKVKTEPGTTIALYTPGATAATDEYGAELGENKFLKTLRDVAARPALTQIDDVLTDLGPFLQSESTENDVTLVLGHRPI